MAHVSPHRWADAARGRLSPAEQRKLEAHAAKCPRCAAARVQIARSLGAFAGIRATEPPRLRWDHIGARIYWITSSERRAAHNQPAQSWRRRMVPAALTVGGIAAVALALYLLVPFAASGLGAAGLALGTDDTKLLQQSLPQAPATPGASSTGPGELLLSDLSAQPPVATSDAARTSGPPAPLEGLVTFLQGEVRRDGRALGFDDPIVAGSRIETGQGKVVVQFDKDSGIALGPRSSLMLTQFDQASVVLAVEGELFVDITRRSEGQSFVVVTGEREIRVRGTAFRVVHRGGQLRVACGHGVIAISDGNAEEELSAGQVIEWAPSGIIRDTARLSEMVRMQREVLRLPVWTGADALRETSSSLAIAGSPERDVKIDGIQIGAGSFTVRVMSGRHFVEADGVLGKWVEVDAGASLATAVRPPQTTSARGKAQRRAELMRELEQSARLDACMRPLRKQGIDEGAFILIEIGILRSGTIEYLNIVDTNVPRTTAQCVRNVVDRIDFGEGSAAVFRQRIAL